MDWLIVAYVLIALCVAWPLNAGMYFHQAQGVWDEDQISQRLKSKREDLATAIALGALFAAIWPLLTPAAFFLSNFAEHGIWRQK